MQQTEHQNPPLSREVRKKLFAKFIGATMRSIHGTEVKLDTDILHNWNLVDYRLVLRPYKHPREEDVIFVMKKLDQRNEFDGDYSIKKLEKELEMHYTDFLRPFFEHDFNLAANKLPLPITLEIYQHLVNNFYDIPHIELGNRTMGEYGDLCEYVVDDNND